MATFEDWYVLQSQPAPTQITKEKFAQSAQSASSRWSFKTRASLDISLFFKFPSFENTARISPCTQSSFNLQAITASDTSLEQLKSR